jgi:epoxyqueuosine reductase
LGFDACGIGAATNVDPEDRLGVWLAQGFHAGMGWMAARKEMRQDVRLRLPGARSVVVVARNYFVGEAEEAARSIASTSTSGQGIRGKVARYAWGRDYHRVLRKPMEALSRAIRELEAGAQCYSSVDTGPVLERAWAARAGLGWIGKNSLVLHPELGSWFFLGVIATTAALEPDIPMESRCGHCTRCMDACPTRAIVEPGVVDARRCISYHTIENRGDVPEDLQAYFDSWVFGCDLCQEVCPWNRRVCESSEPGFHPIADHPAPDLLQWLEMGEAAFNEHFAGTAIRRATYAGMQRNLRIAMKAGKE